MRDFKEIFLHQLWRLDDNDTITLMWNSNGEYDLRSPHMKDFKRHLPVVSEDFWQEALDSMSLYEDGRPLNIPDKTLYKYILCMIRWYTDRHLSGYSGLAAILAGHFYIQLLNIENHYFLREDVYLSTISALKYGGCKPENYSDACALLKTLKVFLTKCNINEKMLLYTLDCFTFLLKKTLHDEHSRVGLIRNEQQVSVESLENFKLLARKQHGLKRLRILYSYLFVGLHDDDNDWVARTFNLKFKETMRRALQELSDIWQNPNEAECICNSLTIYILDKKPVDAKEFKNILEILGETICKIIVARIVELGISYDRKKPNVLSLSFQLIVDFPDQFYDPRKKFILQRSLMNSCLLNIVTEDLGLEVLSNICLIKKPEIQIHFKAVINSDDGIVKSETIIQYCMDTFNDEWTNVNKNIYCLIIMIHTLIYGRDTLHNECFKILGILTKVENLSTLQMIVPFLVVLQTELLNREDRELAFNVFYFICKNALDPEGIYFLKGTYSIIMDPSNDAYVHKKILLGWFLSDNFDYGSIIQKWFEDDIVVMEHVDQLQSEFLYNDFTTLRLLCAICEQRLCNRPIDILYHFSLEENFDWMLEHEEESAAVFYLLNLILSKLNNEANRNNNNTRELVKLLISNVFEALSKFLLPSFAVYNAVTLLKRASLFVEDYDEIRMHLMMFDNLLNRILREFPVSLTTDVALLYASEIITIFDNYSFSRKTERLMKYVVSQYAKNEEFRAEHRKSFTSLLILYGRFALRRKHYVKPALTLIRSAMESSDSNVKPMLLTVMFDICKVWNMGFEKLFGNIFDLLSNDYYPARKEGALHLRFILAKRLIKVDVHDYCKFVCYLGAMDNGFGSYFKLVVGTFLMENSTVIATNFPHLIIYINHYEHHPNYLLRSSSFEEIKEIMKDKFDEDGLYTYLYKPLPIKEKLTVLRTLCESIFDLFCKGMLKPSLNLWSVITDGFYMIKIFLNKTNVPLREHLAEAVMRNVKMYIIEKMYVNETPSEYFDYRTEIEVITKSLLSLAFNTKTEALRYYKYELFDVLFLWLDRMFFDIVATTKTGPHAKELQRLFYKLVPFYDNYKEVVIMKSEVSYFESHSEAELSYVNYCDFHISRRETILNA